MSKLNLGFFKDSDQKDNLAEYRNRILFRFGLVVIILILPLVISNFIDGRILLGAAVLCMVLVLALNSYNINAGKSPAVSMAVFVLIFMLTIGYSFFQRGIYAVLWVYPSIIFISFAVSHRMAQIYTAILFIYFSSLIFYLFDIEFAVRAVLALIITIIFTHLFLNVINQLREKLLEQTLSDPLTGALNRRDMNSRLEEALERKRRTQTPATLLILDIDHFKSINDKFGHPTGDHVLKEIVTLIKTRLRKLDRLFRIGGEEFLLFLPDTPETGALTLAEDLRLVISKANLIENEQITVSIGLSELKQEETLEEWIQQGDIALYKAKESGRNLVLSR